MNAGSEVISTYRIQFSPYFRFNDAIDLTDFLKEIGVSHVYASPVMEAVPGSVHGYDVTDFSRIRQELGGEEGFNELSKRLELQGIGWIQDFVPNHMAMDPANPYLSHVLTDGRKSRYAALFDIDWDHPAFSAGKVCLPVLEKPYVDELMSGNFSFFVKDGIMLKYMNMEIPLSEPSCEIILGRKLYERLGWILSENSEDTRRKTGENRDTHIEFLNEVARKLQKVNNDRKLIHEVLSLQNYILRYRGTTKYEINYRRFFAVNGLICLREEDPGVFEKVHEKILSLINTGKIHGLRLDHVDGLFSPVQYLRRLREVSGNAYIVVEKILERNEHLSSSWPIQGTSGYDFLREVTLLSFDARNSQKLDSIYREFTGNKMKWPDSIYLHKLEAIDSLFPAVLETVSQMFWKGIRSRSFGSGFTYPGIREALREILANIPIYRTYICPESPSENDKEILRSVIEVSKRNRPLITSELDAIEYYVRECDSDSEVSRTVQTLQQYMPAVMAKAVEDKLFFRYNRIISLNEVGMNPFDQDTSTKSFHNFNAVRMKNHPLSMNVLSTHDTKMSEDVRARINVLSEVPDEWKKLVELMHLRNPLLSGDGGNKTISRNDEYYIYQILLGSYPLAEEEMANYRERLMGHIIKAVREAGIETNWETTDSKYEAALTGFVDSILNSNRESGFAVEFWDMYSTVSFHGSMNSITQKILQMMSPGIPDIYQGSEIWNFNFIDPDNRRKVDFQKIIRLHRNVVNEFQNDHGVIKSYLNDYGNSKIKVLLTSLLLNLRKTNPSLFLSGAYTPIQADGPLQENIISFSRSTGAKTLIVAVPRLTVSLRRMELPVGRQTWDGNYIKIPEFISGSFRDLFTDKQFDIKPGTKIEAGDLFAILPFTVLVST